jgi:WD40 repeat protein
MNKILSYLLLLAVGHPLFAQVQFENSLSHTSHFVASSDISSDGTLIATAGPNGFILIRNVETGNILQELKCAQSNIQPLCFSPEANHLIATDGDNSIVVWDVNTGSEIRKLIGHTDKIVALAVSEDYEYIASYGIDNKVIIWNAETGNVIHRIEGLSEPINSIAYHPKGSILLGGGKNGTAFLWDNSKGNLIKSFKAEEDGDIRTVAFSPNGNFFACAGSQNRISIWSTFGYTLENTMLAHIEAIESVSYSPDGRFIVSGGADEYAVLFDVKTGEIVFYTEKQSYPVTSVVFNPNGKSFTSSSVSSDSTKIWNVQSLNITPKLVIKKQKLEEKPKPKPEIAWITENNKESISLGYSVKYKILSEYPLERVNVNVNNERQVTETNFSWEANEWTDIESIVYLNDGDNTINVDLFYSDGFVSSDILNINYRADLADELVRASKTRKVVVWLRETDEYEYKVSGAEGYLFHSEKINVQEAEQPSIDIELVPLKEDVAIILNNITFATNSADLTPESFEELDKVVELLVTNPRIVIEISAHTDDVGSLTYNMLLSDRRAQSVVNYLLDNNIEQNRLVAKGYGPKKPMVPNTSDDNRAFNRRVEFKIIEMTGKQE